MDKKEKIWELGCCVKYRNWGKVDGSKFYRFFYSNSNCIPKTMPFYNFRPNKPMALFLIGSNVSVIGKTNLKEWLSENPQVIGSVVAGKWGKDIPFNISLLSVRKSSAIRAHPDCKFASMLHKQDPTRYRNSIHRPKLTIALTKFEALIGFIPLKDLKHVLRTIPEVMELAGLRFTSPLFGIKGENAEVLNEEYYKIFTKILLSDDTAVREIVGKMIARITREGQVRTLSDRERRAITIEEEHPGDVGVVLSLLLNHVELLPYEAIIIEANVLHTYLMGDCVEFSPNAYNTIKAALTARCPPYRTLCSMISFKQDPPSKFIGKRLSPNVESYQTDFLEFKVDRIQLDLGKKLTINPAPSPSILLFLRGYAMIDVEGSKSRYRGGNVILVKANTKYSIHCKDSFEGVDVLRVRVPVV